MSVFVPFLSLHAIHFHAVSPATSSPAILASSASLAGADADDAGDAGDVVQEMLRMQERTPPMFLRNCVPEGRI